MLGLFCVRKYVHSRLLSAVSVRAAPSTAQIAPNLLPDQADRRWRSRVATTSPRSAARARRRIQIPGWHTLTPEELRFCGRSFTYSFTKE